jgi:Tol biopolymer transport system component
LRPRAGGLIAERLRVEAAWSPSGKEIAIEESVGGGRQRLWVISADGRRGRKAVDYLMTTYGGVDWTPDGETLIYSAVDGERMQLYSVPAKGGVPRKLTTDQQNLLHPQVSPNGKLIAATRLLQRKELWRARLPEDDGTPGSR